MCSQWQVNNLESEQILFPSAPTDFWRKEEGEGKFEGPARLGSARLGSPLHLSGSGVRGKMLKCPRLHLVVQSEEWTNQTEPLRRRRRSWASQSSRTSPAAQLFITHSGVRALFFFEEEEGGLARSGWTWQPARQWQEGGGSYLLPAILRVRSEEPFALRPQRGKGKTGSTRGRRRRRSCGGRGQTVRGCCLFFFGGETGKSLLQLLSRSSVEKTI